MVSPDCMFRRERTSAVHVWRVGAVITVALMLNAFSAAPATHHHGEMHDAGNCPVCILQATGAGLTAPSVKVPVPTITHDAPATVERVCPTSRPIAFFLIRAPPTV